METKSKKRYIKDAISDLVHESYHAQKDKFHAPYIPLSMGTQKYVKRFKVPTNEHTKCLISNGKMTPIELTYEEETVPLSKLAPKELLEFYRREASRTTLHHHPKPERTPEPVVVEPKVPFYRRWWDNIRNFEIEIKQ